MTQIPPQLQNPKYRFIKVKTKTKQPLEPDWVKTNNYQHDNPTLQKHLKQGGNYGILGGYGNLVIIDCDTPQLEQLVEQHLPPTLTIQTGRGGKHYYYHIPDLDAPIRLKDQNNTNIGDIQGYGKQAIGPNSTHPNGNKYQIIKNNPIATTKKENIKLAFKNHMKNDNPITPQATTQDYEGNLNILDIANTSMLTKQGNEYYGPHPTHGSDTGHNFWINTQKNVWHCFRHDTGGGPLELLAIQEGIIQCGDKLRGENFKKTLETANQKYGITLKPKYQKHILDPQTQQTKEKILTLLATGKKPQATEEIVKLLLTREHFHTLRQDDKQEIWIYDQGIYKPNGKTHIKENMRNLLDEAYTTYLAGNVFDKIETDTYIEPKEFFETKHPDEIPVQNGILNTKTHELTPYNPQKIFFNKLPVKYNPHQDCPKIKQFLQQIAKHPEDIPLLEEIAGYCLDKNHTHETAIMLTGTGANGKSQYLTLIKNLLGPENTSELTLNDLEKNFGKENLINKLANISADLPPDALKQNSYFKALTGGDWITADRKFQTTISFRNYAKFLFSANQIPRAYNDTDAFFRRWIILEFPHKFLKKTEINKLPPEEQQQVKEAIPDLANQISTPQELSGLLNLALKALKRIRDQGGFSKSLTTKETEKLWLRKSSSFEAFFMDNLEESWDDEITKKEMRQAFLEYCKTHKLKGTPDKAIKYILAEHGVVEDRPTYGGKTERVWSGIKFKNQKEKTPEFGENYLQNEEINQSESCQGCQPCRGVSTPTGVWTSRGDSKKVSRLATLAESQSPGVLKHFYMPNRGKRIVSSIYIVAEKQDLFSKKDILDYMLSGGCKISAEELDDHFKEFLHKGVLMEVKPGLFQISVEKSV